MTVILRPHQVEALQTMTQFDKGQVVVPTGGGKTFIMIRHAIQRFNVNSVAKTMVVVAPRILLAQQLCDDFLGQNLDGNYNVGIDVLHVHSGKGKHLNTTKINEINNWYHNSIKHQIIFTTYHSLHKLMDSEIEVDTIYFDEAHNSTTKSFFPATDHFSRNASKCYFFTATPKHNYRGKVGMNWSDTYGNIICNIPAPDLIENGSIIPPTIVPFHVDDTIKRTKRDEHNADAHAVIKSLEHIETRSSDYCIQRKVLVAVGSSRILGNMLGQTDMLSRCKELGYDVLHVTSKFGAYVNDKKVSRQEFMDTLSEWGNDDSKKFIVFHYSILSEGINISGLTHCILLRNLNYIEMTQTIGRVIRLHNDDKVKLKNNIIKSGQLNFYRKSTGYVTVPTTRKEIRRRLEKVVHTVFVEGQPIF